MCVFLRICLCWIVYSCMYFYVSVWVSVFLYVCLYNCLSSCMSICVFVCILICMYVYLSVFLYVCLYICLYFCMFVCIYVCPLVCRPVYLTWHATILEQWDKLLGPSGVIIRSWGKMKCLTFLSSIIVIILDVALLLYSFYCCSHCIGHLFSPSSFSSFYLLDLKL